MAERRNRYFLAHATFALLALVAPALLVRWLAPLRVYAEVSSSQRIAERILASPDKGLPVYGFYYFRTGLPFYLRCPVSLVTADGDEMTSNYVISEFAKRRSAGRRAPSGAGGGELSQLRQQESPPINEVLIDDLEFRARIQNPPYGALVLVRNNEAGLLANLNSSQKSPIGLWSFWQDSVWKIPGSAAPLPQPK
jgi:hypothetical protein